MTKLLQFGIRGADALEKAIKSLDAAMDTRQILDQGAAILFNRIRTRFLQEIDPEGVKWPPSKAALWRHAHDKGGGTLFDTGKLFHSLQLFAESPTSRSIGTNATSDKGFPYPIVHQFGLGQVRREFLGFGDADVKLMSEFVVKRIVEEFK